jgi:ribonuclease HI
VTTTATQTIVEVYADGGVVSSSRSAVGGAAAYVHVNGDGSYALEAVDAYVPVRTLTHANATLFMSGVLERACQEAVGEGVRVHVYPYKLETVTNNAMEMLALIACLEALEDGWSGRVCADSMITLGRAFAHRYSTTLPPGIRSASVPWKLDGIDPVYIRRLRESTSRLREIDVCLLDGHPTLAQIEANAGKRGQPVSIHNKRCDWLCGQVTAALRKTVKEEL